MRFSTKLWRRSEKSFATTIPQALLFLLDDKKRYQVKWNYHSKYQIWSVEFLDDSSQPKGKFLTSLWKRSQRSYGTTIPHAVLLHIDEEKSHEAEWTYNKKLQKWVISLKEVEK